MPHSFVHKIIGFSMTFEHMYIIFFPPICLFVSICSSSHQSPPFSQTAPFLVQVMSICVCIENHVLLNLDSVHERKRVCSLQRIVVTVQWQCVTVTCLQPHRGSQLMSGNIKLSNLKSYTILKYKIQVQSLMGFSAIKCVCPSLKCGPYFQMNQLDHIVFIKNIR